MDGVPFVRGNLERLQSKFRRANALLDGGELVNIVPNDPRGKVTPTMAEGGTKYNLRWLTKGIAFA